MQHAKDMTLSQGGKVCTYASPAPQNFTFPSISLVLQCSESFFAYFSIFINFFSIVSVLLTPYISNSSYAVLFHDSSPSFSLLPSITRSFSFFLCLFPPFLFFLSLSHSLSLSVFSSPQYSLSSPSSFILQHIHYLQFLPFLLPHNFFLINLGHKGLCDHCTILLHTT